MTVAEPTQITLSKPLKVDLIVYRGDSGAFRLTVKDDDENPVDISMATWDADIRTKTPSSTLIANFEIVPVVGDPSSIDVKLSSENSILLTANCVYDVEMTIGDTVTTLIGGLVIVSQDVSRL